MLPGFSASQLNKYGICTKFTSGSWFNHNELALLYLLIPGPGNYFGLSFRPCGEIFSPQAIPVGVSPISQLARV
jgi:hypothetical protein